MSSVTVAAPETAQNAEASRKSQFGTAFKNISWIWAGLLVNIGLSFFVAPFVVRSLGNVYYGIWALLNQFTGYLWLFDFGVRDSVIKYVAQHHAADEREELVSTVHAAVSLYAAISAIVMLAVLAMTFALPYVFNIPPDSVTAARVTLFITGATIAQGFVFNVYAGVLMGIQRFYLVDRLGILFSIPRTILIVVLLSAGYGIIALALITFAVSTAGNILVYRLCRVHVPYLSFRFGRPRREDLRRIVDYGKYVLMNNIGEKLVYASDGLVIGVFLPVASLTYFAIGSSLIGYMKSFVVAMATVLNPMSSALDSRKDSQNVKVLFLASCKAAMLVGLPVCIAFILLGERFISIWMGPAFGPIAGQVLAVLAAAHLIGLPYHSFAGVLYGLARHSIVAQLRLFEAVVNLGLSIALIKFVGLIGVAIGTLVPHVIIALVILPALLPKVLEVSPIEYYLSTYVRPLLASIPYAIACVAIDRFVAPATFITFMGCVIAALVTYAVPCWFLVFSGQERELVRSKVRRLVPAFGALKSTTA